MTRGFIISAQNTAEVDYVKCAEVLCRRIKYLMPTESVSLLTDIAFESPIFDHVIQYPHGDRCIHDQWKLANDWQVYEASPYDLTIKLEADIYLPRSISHWWNILSNQDLVISTHIRDFRNQLSDNKFYRKVIVDNALPDTYNAISYFRKSATAQEFFNLVKDIFDNWDQYKKLIKCYDTEQATTDVVYAIAAKIIGVERCTLPSFTDMSMIHMKKMINDSTMNDWTREYLYEISHETLRINTIPQLYPFHYHVKSFSKILAEELYD